jgi:hypothetical protein
MHLGTGKLMFGSVTGRNFMTSSAAVSFTRKVLVYVVTHLALRVKKLGVLEHSENSVHKQST